MRTPFLFLLAASPLLAVDLEFKEAFADPARRATAIETLVPGSRDWFFYLALHQQLSKDDAGFAKTMAAWKTAADDKSRPVSLEGWTTLDNRRILLAYEADPQSSIAELIRRFDITFDAPRPETEAGANLAERLDPALISPEAFRAEALIDGTPGTWDKFRHDGRWAVLDSLESLTDDQLRSFYQTWDDARHPRTVEFLQKIYRLKNPPAFGDGKLESKLTHAQLQELATAVPELLASSRFALDWMTTLPTRMEADAFDPTALAAHVARCRDFALTLPNALNSLKANVLYHHLRLQQALGKSDQDDFITYLKIPRTTHPLLIPTPNPLTANAPDLTSDFSAATGCGPIRDDSPLIMSLLEQFLAAPDSARAYAGLIEPSRLATLHTRARLLSGAGAEDTAGGLPPEALAELKKEVRVGFAPGRPVTLKVNDPVAIPLELKNTPNLLVRVFEIDLPGLARRGDLESVTAMMDTDGLVPHLEKTFTYTETPLKVHRDTIALPELTGEGAWLVEFVSGNAACRTLVRKGQLTPVIHADENGAAIRVYDDAGELRRDASVFIGETRYTPGDDGVIRIARTGSGTKTPCVIAGKLAAETGELPLDEDFFFSAGAHLNLEQLVPNTPAKLLLTPVLRNDHETVPLEKLTKARVSLRVTFSDGLEVERVLLHDAKLQPTMILPFQVPDRTTSIELTLSGEVSTGPGQLPVHIDTSEKWDFENSTQGSIIRPFLSMDSAGFFLELRGHNGEVYPGKPVAFSFSSRDYGSPIEVNLKTDAQGRIALGKLDGITRMIAESPDFPDFRCSPDDYLGDTDYADDVVASLGETIRLPLNPGEETTEASLGLMQTGWEGRVIADFSKHIRTDAGEITIQDLPAGDYQLIRGQSRSSIKVIAAPVKEGGVMIRPGEIQHHFNPQIPVITSAAVEGESLVIRLNRTTPDTRVQVISRRYVDLADSSSGFFPTTFPYDEPIPVSRLACEYLTSRVLSDESRYILERRSATKFPGSLLPRPGLLVNRWTDENSNQADPFSSGGEQGNMVPGPISSKRTGGGSGGGRGNGSADPFGPSPRAMIPGFLAKPSSVLYQLKPDEHGVVTVPLKDLNGAFAQVTATSPDGLFSQNVPLPVSAPELLDQRLTQALDPAKHYLGSRTSAEVKAGTEVSLQGAGDSDWLAVATLRDAFRFLDGTVKAERMPDFTLLLSWNTLMETDKLSFLATHASHELHLFLARKDREFFDKFVKPRLQEKLEPTVVDDILLGRDVTAYLRPYAWQKLNGMEKALLAQALPEARSRIARELDLRWKTEAPGASWLDDLFAATLRGKAEDLAATDPFASDMPSTGAAYLQDKLQAMIIPEINFTNTSLREAVNFLRTQAQLSDRTEADPDKRGINIVIQQPRGSSSSSLGDSKTINELKLRNVTFAEALRYICDATGTRYKVDLESVTILTATETGEDLISRQFTLTPQTVRALKKAGESIVDILKSRGVTFPDGAMATLSGNTLIVRNNPGNIAAIELFVEWTASKSERDMDFSSSDDSADPFGPSDNYEPPELPNSVGSSRYRLPESPGQPERPEGLASWEATRDQTSVWREQNYYRYRGQTGEDFIPLSGFWLDLAKWDGQGRFLSPHFNQCTRNLNEALLCLAFLDLPFTATAPETQVDGSTLKIKSAEPMLLYYQQMREDQAPPQDSPVLIRQTFHPLEDRFREVDGRQVENILSGPFSTGVAYSMSLVVTNLSGTERRVEILAQIPAGAIALQGATPTLSKGIDLGTNDVVEETLSFYFPSPGDFTVYPLHVAEEGKTLAATAPRTLVVTDKPAAEDATTWSAIARGGSPEAVLDYLRTAPLAKTDLRLIRWRLLDRDFFSRVMELCRDRLDVPQDIAAYGLHHRDDDAIRTLLEDRSRRDLTGGMLRDVGLWLDSPLLQVRPRIHFDAETVEFDALINSRSHRLGENARLSNPQALAAYETLLDQLDWKPAPDDGDRLALCANLLLQDRVEEGLKTFDLIDPAKLTTRLQYDYLHCVVLFFRSNPQQAREIAVNHLAGPQEQWVQRFSSVVAQADEIARITGPGGVGAAPEEEKQAEPSLELLTTADRQLLVKSARLESTELKFYQVDLEMLFSKNPFLSSESKSLPEILPNDSLQVQLNANGETQIEIPARFRGGNVLISAGSGDTTALRVMDSPALTLTRQTADRTLQVTDTATRLPLPGTYVKIYRMDEEGDPVFYKDGYTDLRGKFDYLSHTGTEPGEIRKLAILILHPEKGARVEIISL